jgi:ABC-2 type transport system permease protein
MIRLSRISALVSRHLIPTFRDPMRITDMLYYPLIDIIQLGFLVIWANEGGAKSHAFIYAFLTCVACWYLVYRSALEISRNLLVEIWEHHLINLLAGPLSLLEFMLSLMCIGLVQALITLFYSSCAILFIFSENIFTAYPLILPYIPLFIIFGWTVGLVTASLIFYFGKSVEFIAWAFPWFFALISGAYYPLSLLPMWAQKMAALFPVSHLFEGVRTTLKNGQLAPTLPLAIFLTVSYFLAAFALLVWMFNKRKEKGFNHLS